MKINQIFSHRHRGIIFIGALNSPLHKPDRRAKRIPSVTGSSLSGYPRGHFSHRHEPGAEHFAFPFLYLQRLRELELCRGLLRLAKVLQDPSQAVVHRRIVQTEGQGSPQRLLRLRFIPRPLPQLPELIVQLAAFRVLPQALRE